jgi:hypothetical protein
MQFPEATKVDPLYRIDGALYQLLTHKEGQRDAEAVRAALPIVKGKDKGGQRIGWFRRVNKPLLSDGEINSVETVRADVNNPNTTSLHPDDVHFLINLIDAMRERSEK